jgi:hypothetical protein
MASVGAALAAGTGETRSQTHVSCGEPTPLQGRNSPQVGPLVLGFYTLGTNRSGRAESVFDAGYPTKVLLHLQPPRRLRYPLTLRGWNCRDGTPLRFWYGPSEFPREGTPLTANQLRRIGALTPLLPATKRVEFRGYMLFTQPGRWKVSVYRRAKRLGSVVVLVGAH